MDATIHQLPLELPGQPTGEPAPWLLDDATRETGRLGVARARAALRDARRSARGAERPAA